MQPLQFSTVDKHMGVPVHKALNGKKDAKPNDA